MAGWDRVHRQVSFISQLFLFSARGRLICAIAVMILLAGLWTAKQSGFDTDIRMRRQLVYQAEKVAGTLNPSLLASFSYAAEDRSNSEFIKLSCQLKMYAELAEVDRLYVVTAADQNAVMGPDSLRETHPRHLAPGTAYKKIPSRVFETLATGISQIQGPDGRNPAVPVTAFAAVSDYETGNILAVVGAEVDAREWQAAVSYSQRVPAVMTLILLGVLLLSGLFLAYVNSRSVGHQQTIHYAETIFCFVFMSLLTLVAAVRLHQNESNMRRHEFHSLSDSHAVSCAGRMADLDTGIQQLARFFESSRNGVTRREFQEFCRTFLEVPSIAGCMWIPEIPAERADAFVRSVREKSGRADFSIHQAGESQLSGHSALYPVLYFEPSVRSADMVGVNVGSNPKLLPVIQEALRTGKAIASDPIPSSVRQDSRPLIYIFKRTALSRRTGLIAFIMQPEYLLGDEHLFRLTRQGVRVSLLQMKPDEGVQLVARLPHVDNSTEIEADGIHTLDEVVPVFDFGRAYAFVLRPHDTWLAAHPMTHGWFAAGIGLLITLLVSLLVALTSSRRIQLQKEVVKRTTELEESRARYRQLANHTEGVREEERKRIARELHDDIGQILTAMKIDLALVEKECNCKGSVARKLEDIRRLLGEGIQTVHSLCRRMRPGALDDLGLEDALQGLIDDWCRRASAECSLQVDLPEEELPDAVNTALFRMVQEALTNVSRYAEASQVEIRLVSDKEQISCAVTDDGHGMEPGAADKPNSFGLLGMRERIEAVGGTFEVESEPGLGTSVRARIPLK